MSQPDKQRSEKTPELVVQARELHAAGLSYPKIGKKLGIPWSTIRGWLYEASQAEVVHNNWGMKKTPELVAKATELRDAGLSYRAIGIRLGVSWGTARMWLDPEYQTAQHRTKRNRRRQDLRNHKYRTNLLYKVKQRLRIIQAQADRLGYAACSTTPEEVMAAFTGHCDCCHRHESECGGLCIDHNHKPPGQFRAWLCNNCNTAIGMLQDDPVILRRAADLLER